MTDLKNSATVCMVLKLYIFSIFRTVCLGGLIALKVAQRLVTPKPQKMIYLSEFKCRRYDNFLAVCIAEEAYLACTASDLLLLFESIPLRVFIMKVYVLKLTDDQEYLSFFSSNTQRKGKRVDIWRNDSCRSIVPFPVVPYFAHPDYYKTGMYRLAHKYRHGDRRFRIAFAGTTERNAYANSFAFPILNRFEILNFLIEEFADDVFMIADDCVPDSHKGIVLSLTSNTADDNRKHRMNQKKYLRFLASADFMIAPPGWSMPLCHNLVEAMSVGTIPITNYSMYVHPYPLEHKKTSMCFSSYLELKAIVNDILAMEQKEIIGLRENVIEHYDQVFSPLSVGRFLETHSRTFDKIVVLHERTR